MLHHLSWFLFSLHQFLFSAAKHCIFKNHQSPQEIPRRKPNIILMLNQSNTYLLDCLEYVYTFFGILSNSQDQWLWSCQIPFSKLIDNMQKRTFYYPFCFAFVCRHCCLNSALLNEQTHLQGAWLMKGGAFWTIEEFLCIQKAEFPLEPKIRAASFTSVF